MPVPPAPPRRNPTWIWVLAAAAAAAIHAGALAAVLADTRVEDEDDLGAPALEVSLELASPRMEPTDLPPGPETDASAAAPAATEQKTVEEKTDLPKDTPTESEDPDQVVAREPTEKPKEEQPVVETNQASPSQESIAAEATAPPVSETTQEAPRSTAPVLGTGQSTARVKATWQKQLVAHLDRSKRYPPGAARRASEVVISFTLDRTGHVLSSSVVRSSGDPVFDEAALAMMRRADPVPQPPALVADDGLTFTLPVMFRAKRQG